MLLHPAHLKIQHVLERAQRRRGCSATRIGCIPDHGTAIFIIAASPTEGWVGTKRRLRLLLLLLLVHGSRENRNRCARTVRPSRLRVKGVQQVIAFACEGSAASHRVCV